MSPAHGTGTVRETIAADAANFCMVRPLTRAKMKRRSSIDLRDSDEI
jgi:hypothetical protein